MNSKVSQADLFFNGADLSCNGCKSAQDKFNAEEDKHRTENGDHNPIGLFPDKLSRISDNGGNEAVPSEIGSDVTQVKNCRTGITKRLVRLHDETQTDDSSP